jgi:hypothetical protein
MSGERRRRTAAALAASALLHFVAALFVLRGAGREKLVEPTAARPPNPIELALIDDGRDIDTAAPAPPSADAPPARRHAPKAVGSPAPPAPDTPKPPVVPGPPPAGAASPPRAIDLSFDRLAEPAKARAAGRSDAQEDLERLLVPAPPPRGLRVPLAELRADAERRADAAANVRAGRAHPLLFDYLRAARDRLSPAATKIAESLSLGPAETTRGWGRGYMGATAEAHRRPFALDRPVEETFGGPRPDVLGAYDESRRQAESGAEERTAEVCLGVAPGHAVVVTLRRSSGNAALDRLALDAFRAAGDDRAPTAEVRPELACYRVRVSAYRLPPLPTIGLDLANRRVLFPLRRMTKVNVELESVDFGPKPQTSPLIHTPQ